MSQSHLSPLKRTSHRRVRRRLLLLITELVQLAFGACKRNKILVARLQHGPPQSIKAKPTADNDGPMGGCPCDHRLGRPSGRAYLWASPRATGSRGRRNNFCRHSFFRVSIDDIRLGLYWRPLVGLAYK